MADLFINNDKLNELDKNSRESWSKQNQETQQHKENYLENLNKYTVNIPQEQYNIINNAISNAEIPEDEAYRWASAFELEKQYHLPLDYAYKNQDQIIASIWQDKYQFTPKTAFKAIVDSGKLGTNTLKQAFIGTKVMAAEQAGEDITSLLDEYDAIEKENEGLYDYMDRNFFVDALKFGAQSLPFTGYVAGAGMLGSLLTPGVGTGAAFTASMQQASAMQYMEIRKAGGTKENALGVSLIDGALEAIVETSLGNVAGALGKNAVGAAAKKEAVEKITANLFKKLHYNGTMKNLALKLGTEYVKENVEEGLEEVIQGLISDGTSALAAELGNYDIDGKTAQEAAKEAWENFYGGFAGSLVLGLPTSAIKVRTDLNEHTKVKQAAENIPSEKMFKDAVKDSPIFEGMEEAEKNQVISDIHTAAQNRVEEELNLHAKEYGEVTGSENFEQEQTDEETGDVIPEEEFRTEQGQLHTQNVVVSEDDGIVKGVFGVGNPTKKENNKYAEISYTLDEANNTVTIDALKVGKSRQNLKEEVYDSFARSFPGLDIQWNAIGKVAQDWKQSFINANPQGKGAGLNYYKNSDEIADAETRKEVVKQIKNAYKKAGKNLTDKQLAADTVILESLFRRLRDQSEFKERGIDTFTKYVNYTFGNNIFGERADVNAAAQQKYGQDAIAQGASLPRNFNELDRDIKAVVYVTENGDFSTFSHEIAHIARKQLSGDLLKQVEDAMGVTDGNWTIEKEEKFAYGFEQFLREGKVENENLRPFFERVAQFLVDCFNKLKNVIQMAPEIEKVYNELLSQGESGTLAAAQKAVTQAESEARKADAERQKKEEETAKQKETEEKARAKEQAIEDNEVIFEEETADNTVPQNDTETQSETVPQNDTVKETLDKTSLPEEKKAEIAEVLNNEESSLTEKVEAADEAASEQFDIFQIIGELGATELDRAEEVTTRMDNLEIARQMEAAGKDTKTIRLATGWEKGVDGKWKYEISDGKLLDNWETDTTKDNQEYKYSTLGNIYDNDKLYKAYPELKNINVYISPMEGLLMGKYNPSVGITLNESLFNGPIPGIYESIKEMEKQPEYLEYSKNFDSIMDNAGEDYVQLEKDLDKLKNDFDKSDFGKKYNELLNKPRYGFSITEAGRSTLVHEIQHAIQDKEGFAKGGNEKKAKRHVLESTYFTLEDKQKSNWYTYYLREESAADFALQRKRILKNPELIKKTGYWQAHSWGVPKHGTQEYNNYLWDRVRGWIEETEESIAGNDGYEKILKSYYEKSEEELKKIRSQNKYRANKYKDLYFNIYRLEKKRAEYDKLTDYELYTRLAGEVESRNVQARMDLNDAERLAKTLAETEDIERNDQLIMFQALQMAEQDKAAAEEEEIRKQYENTDKWMKAPDLFQTQAELYADARTFEKWQDFMEFYETMGKPEVTPIPFDADAQWYQTTWELANKVTPEESLINEELQKKNDAEGATPKALDSLFIANIVENDENLQDFLETLSAYDQIDLNSAEWARVEDQEQAEERQHIADLQNYMKTIMYSRSWKQAMASLKAGKEVTPTDFRNVRGEMRDNFKARDFRSLYYTVTGDEMYKVDEKDLPSTIMKERLNKHPERYYDIVSADDDFTSYSPEKRKQISKAMDNADLAAKIKSGQLKMDDEVHDYIKLLDKQINTLKQQLTEQEIAAENDMKDIADVERRQLLKLHDKMLLAKSEYKGTNDEITRRLNKGIRITSKYKRENQNLKANYNELYRKFSDLKTMIVIDAQVESALKRQETIHQIKEEIGTKQAEKSRAAEEKKLRIQLVKRTMRRIDFKKIDYEDAKTIIAIQRIFEPNLMGGVNRWIGTEGPFLRGVISGILTDVEYKEQIEKYLQQNAKGSQAYADFVKLLHDTKSLEDFNNWTQKDRKAALRYLPKENWLKDLNLVKLAKEREESIDLDIEQVEQQKPSIDPKTGEQKTYKDANGETHLAYTTAFAVQFSDEIAQRVRDAIGADMFDNLVNVPFADWTFEQLEQLATRINDLYINGRDTLEGKKAAKKEAADRIRNAIEQQVKNTGIIINDDDDEETKKAKLEKINTILGLTGSNVKGTETSKDTGFKARLNRLLHSYNDANVLRVARILDGYTEGTNYQELYRKEDNCYIAKTRSMNNRAKHIQEVMENNNITPTDLATIVKVEVPAFDGINATITQEYTIDDLLYFVAASKDYATNDNGAYDDYAACSRNAVMYGNMFSSAADLEQKQAMAENEELDVTGQSMAQISYIAKCKERFSKVLEAADKLDPKYKALLDAISEDYANQYERMNKVSIEEFNSPVHRVKCYVPLTRLESNGDTNVNKVKEDLLAAMGANATKQGVNKGMTARRVRMNPFHQKPVVTGLYKTWSDSVERTEHFIAYSEYVNELNRVYKNRDAQFTRQFIENRYGKGMLRYIDDYINEVANPNANKVREAGAELLHTFRGKTAPAYLAWKASAIIKQGLTSPWPFMQYINPAEYLSASWKAITSKGEIYKAIKEKSVYMNNRVMDPMNDLIDEMAEQGKTKFDRAMGKQSQIGMKGLEWIDWVCVAPGWYAAYQKEFARLNGHNEDVYQAEKERLTEENMYAEVGTSAWKTKEQIEALAMKAMTDDVERRAVQYADDITRSCQPSNRAVDIAPLFKNSSEAMKAYLQFQTSLNVIWQNIRYDTQYYSKKPDAVAKEQFMKISGIIIGYAMAGIFMNSVMEGLGGDDDKDGDKADDQLKNLVYYATTQFTDAVPMIGSELTNTMDKLITGKANYQSSGTDMTPTVTKFLAILTNAKKGNWEKAAEMTAEGIGMYLGLPVSGVKEIGKLAGVGDKEEGLGINLGEVYGILEDEE